MRCSRMTGCTPVRRLRERIEPVGKNSVIPIQGKVFEAFPVLFASLLESEVLNFHSKQIYF